MHYKPRGLGLSGLESQVDGAPFFVHPKGKVDPAAEWRADSAALFDTVAQGDTAFACRFPARAAWMRARLAPGSPVPVCPEYDAFRTHLAADSVALVFASSYINSPPSAFGHVYLKLRRKGRGTAGLSDYTVAFGARMEGAGPVRVAYAGFTGGFKGYYNVLPFDASLRKYAYLDQRDQWVFPLRLDSSRVDRLVAHLWELRRTHIDYYFLTENCAHHLASLLEAADFDADLGGVAIPTPVHVARRAGTSGLAGAPTFVPSSRSDLARRLAALTPREHRVLEDMIDAGYAPEVADGLGDTARARVLDAAARHMDYTRRTEWIFDSTLHARRLDMVARRAALPEYRAPSPPAQASPVASHYAPRLEVGYRYRGTEAGAIGVEAMPAFHARTDDPAGVGNTFEFRVLVLEAQYDLGRNAARFERFTAVDLFSFAPAVPLLGGFAWSARSDLDQSGGAPLDLNASAGAGKAFPLFSPDNRQVAFGLATGGARWRFEDARADLFVGARAGLALTPLPRARAAFDAEWRAWTRGPAALEVGAKAQYNFTPNLGLIQGVRWREQDGLGPLWQTAFVGHF